ncbi:MAG: uracil-DNA glycosylase family protein, partial [Bacteroidales bacterium]
SEKGMDTFADKIISFCFSLDFKGALPDGISVMNPFRNNPEVMAVISQFYRKFYSDNRERHMILGINPGRFGAGVTGIPFTDTVRLKEKCGLAIPGLKSFETSSVFIYEIIEKYGGPGKFYGDFYISSVSPLGFTLTGKKGKETNFNYYDSRQLTGSIMDFVISSLKEQLAFGIKKDVCFCLGTGKNYRFLSGLNDELHIFKRIEPLEHPRFIMQYRSREKTSYIDNYMGKLKHREMPD